MSEREAAIFISRRAEATCSQDSVFETLILGALGRKAIGDVQNEHNAANALTRVEICEKTSRNDMNH